MQANQPRLGESVVAEYGSILETQADFLADGISLYGIEAIIKNRISAHSANASRDWLHNAFATSDAVVIKGDLSLMKVVRNYPRFVDLTAKHSLMQGALPVKYESIEGTSLHIDSSNKVSDDPMQYLVDVRILQQYKNIVNKYMNQRLPAEPAKFQHFFYLNHDRSNSYLFPLVIGQVGAGSKVASSEFYNNRWVPGYSNWGKPASKRIKNEEPAPPKGQGNILQDILDAAKNGGSAWNNGLRDRAANGELKNVIKEYFKLKEFLNDVSLHASNPGLDPSNFKQITLNQLSKFK